MQPTMKVKKTILITACIILSSISSYAVTSPLLKKEIEVAKISDTLTNSKTETYTYSYPMINENGFLGTYVEKYVYDSEGRITSKTQTKLNVPYVGCEAVHLIKIKKTRFNENGDITSVRKIHKLSKGVYIKKDIKISYSASGKKQKCDYLKVSHPQHSYKEPNKVQLFIHALQH